MQANVYTVFPVDQSSIAVVYNGSQVDNVNFGADSVSNDFLAAIHNASAGMTHMRRLSASECLGVYSTQYMSSQGDLIVVQNEKFSLSAQYGALSISPFIATWDGREAHHKSVPYVSEPSEYPSHQWQCQPTFHQTHKETRLTCDQPELSTEPQWYPYGFLVQYCLSENVPERCQVNWNRQFAIIVAVSNFAKVICMFLTLWRHDVSAIMTLGDAIQSFLDRPEPCAQGSYTRSDGSVRLLKDWPDDALVIQSLTHEAVKKVTRETFGDYVNNPKLKRWRPRAQIWCGAASFDRWVLCLSFNFIVVQGHSVTWTDLRNADLGEPVGNNIFSMDISLAATVVIANIPQIILSYVYILFNSLYTCMLAGHEWTQFAKHRKTLRVTSPVGAQRSTFWLQLPYRYSLPLVTCSSLLAWLASQSLFLVKIEVLEHDGPSGPRVVRPDKSVLSCGFCPGAIILAIMVGTLIMLGAVVLGLRQYISDMPLASTNSAAISAACQRGPDDPDASLLPLKWGVVSKRNGIRHCCFSSKRVIPLKPGQLYLAHGSRVGNGGIFTRRQ
ncbi:MAG: hypothetical protein Q9207_004090 [Kuettlingeria erythrocarpa]